MAFELKLSELPIIKATEFWSQLAERPNESGLGDDGVDDETEPNLLRKLKAALGFALDLNERISRREKVRVQDVAGVCRKVEVANLVANRESATLQIAAGPDMFRPRHNEASKALVGPGLETVQSASFNQLIAEPTESKSGLVVAEVWSGDDPKPYVRKARTVAVSVLQAEINRPTDSHRKKVRIRKQSRR